MIYIYLVVKHLLMYFVYMLFYLCLLIHTLKHVYVLLLIILIHKNIVLYKVEEEIHGAGSVGASIADTDSLVERCTEEGCKKYIGSFSPTLFISKIREFII